jgi:hypothetical protein
MEPVAKPSAGAIVGEVFRSQSQERHRFAGRDEWVGDDALVAKRQAGDCLTVGERKQDQPLERRGFIQLGEPVGNLDIGGGLEPQLDRGRALLSRATRDAAVMLGGAAQVGDVFDGEQLIDRAGHDAFLSMA